MLSVYFLHPPPKIKDGMEQYRYTPRRSLFERIFSKPPKVAVCLHIFYPEIVPEIVTHLEKIRMNYALFVTCNESLSVEVWGQIERLNRDIYFIETENDGYDIKPFLRVLNHPWIKPFEYVVKVHTKKGSEQVGRVWRAVMLKSLLGRATFKKIYEAFERDRQLKMAGPAALYLSAPTFMDNNGPSCRRISQNVMNGFWLSDWGFFAGTMFWARRKALDSLLVLDGPEYDHAVVQSTDGALGHAIERMFGLVACMDGGRIATVDGKTGILHVSEGAGTPSRDNITRTLVNLKPAYT